MVIIPGFNKTKQRCIHTFKIVKSSACYKLIVISQYGSLLSVDQIKIFCNYFSRLNTKLFCKHFIKIILFQSACTKYRQHIHLIIKSKSFVNFSVKMYRHIRNNKKILIYIKQPCLYSVFGTCHNSSCNCQRLIKPCGINHSAIAFNIQLQIAV